MRAHSAGGVSIAVFAGAIFATLLGTIYHAAADGGADTDSVRVVSVRSTAAASQPTWSPTVEPIPVGHDAPDTMVAMIDAERDDIVDPETGVRVGPLTLHPATKPAATPPVLETPSRGQRRRRPAMRRSVTPPTVTPRLHPDAGRHVILTARGMIARGETVNGSCYRYLSEVFSRAGHSHWRTRRVVYRAGRNGPYADLGVIRTGDWLYIVNHPESDPVGTHSVLFVSWEDRARGYARVIEHPGWGGATSGRERSYDVSRTYRVIRPVLQR